MSTLHGSHSMAATTSSGAQRVCLAHRKNCCSLRVQPKWNLDLKVIRPLGRRCKPTDQCKAVPLEVISMASVNDSQNVDLPRTLPKRKKKPFVNPPQRNKKKVSLVHPEDQPVRAPANGMLVEELIPVAHEVMKAKAIVTAGVHRLLEEIPVCACRLCSDIHIGSGGHNLRTCQGPGSAARKSHHEWVKGNINDVLVPIETYHNLDRLAPPIRHEERFNVSLISAVEELCIQAGVDVPEYPIKRYNTPVEPLTKLARAAARWAIPGQITYYTAAGSYQLDPSKGRKQQYRDVTIGLARDRANRVEESYVSQGSEQLEDGPKEVSRSGDRSSFGEEFATEINAEDDIKTVAKKTLLAWDSMREGAQKLMTRYRVLACGYCPEIHVGPRGHRARVCGAFKHQWRDGRHGWQDASIDELIPPQYVWHVRDRSGPPLYNFLRSFYGKAPAVVELCVRAGASIPDKYKAVMRLDVAIPAIDEARNVV